MGNALSWTEARTRHFLDTVTLGEYKIEAGPIGPIVPKKRGGGFRRPWGYIVTDKARPGVQYKGRTPKQACEAAGLTLNYITGYKGDK